MAVTIALGGRFAAGPQTPVTHPVPVYLVDYTHDLTDNDGNKLIIWEESEQDG